MKTSTAVIVVVILIILLGGGWYYFMQTPAPSSTEVIQQPGADGQEDGDGTSVGQNLILGVTANNTLGEFLSAYNGMTLYSYSPDAATPGKSACSGQCAVNWPPYTVASAADINVSAATSGKVSTIARADGTLQVTYNGVPLYYYIKDVNPGDTVGQGVGGVWYVVTP